MRRDTIYLLFWYLNFGSKLLRSVCLVSENFADLLRDLAEHQIQHVEI